MSDTQTISGASKAEGPWVVHALKPGHGIMEYMVERTLGGGGFGITYLARDENLNLPVAVKEYLPTDLALRADDGSVRPLSDEHKEQFDWGLERFLAEARALATFRHPNIVRALRYFPANGTAYIVMEFESGESLKKWLPRQNNFTRSNLLKLIQPLLDGLETIHKAGYLHRDIKPDNIYMRSDNTPVLIDFGSARSTNSERDMTSIVSPGFAPLEQYQSKGNQGPWTDLYSLAAVMYWMVSGVKPPNSIERLKQDCMQPATQLECRSRYDESLLGAIDWALNPDESKRPQTVAEFRRRLLPDAMAEQPESANQTTADNMVWDITTPSGKSTQTGEGQGNNLVCSILFLDIVAYSKTSVNEQYQLKSNFNQLIAGKLAHVPDSARITLDTGDGAVICFMGDPEEVLYAARDIQRTLAGQSRLQVRMGLHIGPVRILNDLNGHNNVIGDGINVAQRVMSFADSNSLVVSRAFYEITSCISSGGERGFSYLGERRDKHDRVHEIYAVLNTASEETAEDRTLNLADNSQSMHNSIDADSLANLEKELTHYLGPLAPVLIRKLKSRAADAGTLRTLLAQSIGNPQQRAEFLQGPHSNSRNHDSRSKTNLHNSTLADAATGIHEHSHPSGVSAPSIPSWLSSDSANQLEMQLAKAIGPMAKLLLKKELRKASSFVNLCSALAQHIDNLQARAEFIKNTQQLRH